MSLPSGYKRLEYIQSSGTQYIDTGFTPTNETDMEVEFLSPETQPLGAVAWCETTWGQNMYGIDMGGAMFGTEGYLGYVYTPKVRHVAKLAGGVFSDNGTVYYTAQPQTFTAGTPLTIFVANRAWEGIVQYFSGYLYGLKLWQSGTLIRDFIPCKNSSGVIGLWDDVNSQFYANAGTGVFAAGPEVAGTHKARIDATDYEIKGGTCTIDATGYKIKKGRTRIDATGYDIALESGTPLSEIPVGNTVKIAVNGTMRDWIVVNQGIPSGNQMYDDSCNGTWLLMKDIYEKMAWDGSNVNNLENGAIHSYLNSTFLNLVDANIRDAIKQVKIPYRKGGGSGGTDQSGANGLSAKIFILSCYELGLASDGFSAYPVDGAKLDYFESGTATTANNKRIANYGGSAADWWSRSMHTGFTYFAFFVDSSGVGSGSNASNIHGIRPAMILPFDTLVADDGTVLG